MYPRFLTRCAPLLGALMLLAAPAVAQHPDTSRSFDFTIANIMRGPEVYGREPERVRWSADGKWIYFMWNPPGTDWREPPRLYRVRASAGAAPERVPDSQVDSVAPLLETGRLSPDGRLRVVSAAGDLYLVDVARATVRRLTETMADESSPSFSADGRQVFFVRDNNVYALTLDGGLVRQLTDLRAGPAPEEPKRAEGQRAALEAEQRELFGVIRDRLREDSIRKAETRARDSLRVHPLYLQKGERVTSLAVSPTGRALLITTAIPDERALATKIPNYVTESGYTEEIAGRTKVGDYQSGGRVAFMSLPSGTVHFLALAPDSARSLSSATVLGWNEAGTMALLFSVSRDFKDRWIHTVTAGGTLHLVDALHDSAWVDGPCFGCGGWSEHGRRLWFVSEADGFAHLYSMAADGSDRRQLTRGRWEVSGVQLSRDGRYFYLTTSEQSPFEQHVYRMPVAGGARERLTSRVGAHDVTLSPDETMLADVYSEANRPPELFIQPNRPGAAMAQLTVSPTRAWLSFPWIRPAIVMVPASDGVQVPARIYQPGDMGARPNGAAVIFVHGAGYLHNVHNYWSSYAREYMFNQYLASRGYVVLDLDYRGSAGYGRDWRTAIYRWMGGRDLQDEVEGSRYLHQRFGIDPERVGIYGGSYGGFMTLMALFTAPKSFGAGAALRSVTDWAHYNNGYTARILNFPDRDTLAYRRSSPIFFAAGLEDPLLMCHGMVDTNVHFEDIVRLTQRLIELGKQHWSLAPYPVESHGFVRPDSWTDEYTRIFDLFQ
ncbi:MAG TPA: prolyl oligopeptidase family serine peptidase, partial [Gemmatimonadaceae bacterium]|nr:prolyl oligopeptidase family serine peptidase [Gemmatimonadaceae bacterium]